MSFLLFHLIFLQFPLLLVLLFLNHYDYFKINGIFGVLLYSQDIKAKDNFCFNNNLLYVLNHDNGIAISLFSFIHLFLVIIHSISNFLIFQKSIFYSLILIFNYYLIVSFLYRKFIFRIIIKYLPCDIIVNLLLHFLILIIINSFYWVLTILTFLKFSVHFLLKISSNFFVFLNYFYTLLLFKLMLRSCIS